jgi:hypothetical protein
VGPGHTGIFGIAAVEITPHAADQGDHLLARGKGAIAILDNLADRLDADHPGKLDTR